MNKLALHNSVLSKVLQGYSIIRCLLVTRKALLFELFTCRPTFDEFVLKLDRSSCKGVASSNQLISLNILMSSVQVATDKLTVLEGRSFSYNKISSGPQIEP